MTHLLPKRTILIILLFGSALSLQAQVTEYFEGFTDGATSFTTSGQQFTLTNKFQISKLAGAGVDNHTPASTSGTSDLYIDNFTGSTSSSDVGQINSIKTTDGALFTMKSLYFYVSSDIASNHPNTPSGTIVFRGKLGGVTQYTITISSTTFPNNNFTTYSGFNYLDFSTTTDNSLTNIDELEVQATVNFVYVAIDNFQYGNAVPTPVKLLNFSAQQENKSIRLQWQTAQENNSKSFEIEHSMNTTNWNTLATQPAAGNSAVVSSYSFNDASPTYGKNYYRLKQVDIDGSFTYSNVVSAEWSGTSGTLVEVYPNPVANSFTVDLHQAITRPVYYELVTASGAVVRKGYITSNGQQVNIAALPKNIYLLKMLQTTTKIVKN
ncbi:MAG: T9SS type A sorting domain-containing protein [Bacteroidota bacterium]|nr:T9SS type A sorting domain-containing protein [Bacteroidota bacterium]